MSTPANRSGLPLATRLLRAGRSSAPLRYDTDAGLERHRELVQLGVPVAEWARAEERASTRVAWLRKTTTKTVIGFGIAAVIAGSAWAYSESRRAAHSGPTPVHRAESVGIAAPPHPRSATAITPLDALERVPEKTPDAPTTEARPRRASGGEQRPLASPPIVLDGVEAPVDLDGIDAPVASRPSEPAERPQNVPPGTAPSSPSPPSGTSQRPASNAPDVSQEVAEAAAAEKLLASDPAQALSLARSGDARFPSGFLRQERRYIAVMALFQLGNADQARREALLFLRDYPAGAYARRVRAKLVTPATK